MSAWKVENDRNDCTATLTIKLVYDKEEFDYQERTRILAEWRRKRGREEGEERRRKRVKTMVSHQASIADRIEEQRRFLEDKDIRELCGDLMDSGDESIISE